MRIGLFHANIPEPGRKPGGSEVYVARLAGALADAGHYVEVWCYAGEPSHPLVHLKRLKPRWLGTARAIRQYVAPLGLNLRRTGHLDVLHLFGDDWFFVRRRVPTVRTMLGSALMEAVTATSILRGSEQMVCFGLELLSARLADAVYGIGTDSQTLYHGDGILGSGVAPVTDPPTREHRPTILFVGAWSGRKRGEFLQRVFASEVLPRVPNAQLWMVSDRVATAEGVTWFDRPTDDELRSLYRRAWTFCLPSTYEGFGLPYLEALAYGLDVVATPNFGALSLLRGAGRIVTDDELGDALVAGLVAAPHQRSRVAAAARQRAGDYAWPAIVAAHEAAYRLACARYQLRPRRRGHRGGCPD
jgi:phosphatidyl-myo-inositol alpha-mannosyltransferase